MILMSVGRLVLPWIFTNKQGKCLTVEFSNNLTDAHCILFYRSCNFDTNVDR